MDAEREIRVSRDKLNILRVGGLIKRGGLSFMDVVNLIPKDQYLQQRASHVLIHTLEYHKYEPSKKEIIALTNLLKQKGMIEGAYRNILRTLDELDAYPEEVEGFLFDYCSTAMTNLTRPLAIRAFSIPIAFKIGVKYPDLLKELRELLHGIAEEDGVSVQSRKRDYLKRIDKLLP
ncbi:hypothetical protein [Parvicella tangerina]|uniref:Uncharacterized protein n=1 Tax=Parvicella tangerina TaxID=2829795 RepID=A0A916JLV3_9FLAO|nr:hypothetical protein [Parvicella tangerina]CAG5080645.1 hypothetical protein CRYO30217_01406 [Parvicella tangerina]